MNAFRKQFSTGYRNQNNQLTVSPAQSSQIVAILSAGTFFGALFAAPLADRLGRRPSLIIAVGIFSFGVLLQTCAMHIPLLIAGRYEIHCPRPFCYPELTGLCADSSQV
jgi:MFS family permease